MSFVRGYVLPVALGVGLTLLAGRCASEARPITHCPLDTLTQATHAACRERR